MPCVKCADCGFFTIRDWQKPGLLELDRWYRNEGKSRGVLNTYRNEFFGKPLCVEEQFNLPAEFSSEDPSPEEIVAVSHKPRDCNGFTPYKVGVSPQGHREMKLLQEVQAENRRAREEDIARNDKARKDESDLAEKRHRENLAWQKQVEGNVESRFGRSVGFGFLNTTLTIAGGGAAGGAVSAIVTWLMQRGAH